MRVAIVGAGAVGRSIAGSCSANGHSVMLIEKDGPQGPHPAGAAAPSGSRPTPARWPRWRRPSWPPATWSIAATGDDKVNLVVSLLAKTEFAVNRVVARVKDPRNEWLYTEAWGVDVAVSTPRVLAALVEEAVTVGDVVRLMSFRKGAANLVEITLAEDAPWIGRPLRDVPLPRESVLTAILRGERVDHPRPGRAARGRRRAAVRHPRRRRGAAEVGARPRVGDRPLSLRPVPRAAAGSSAVGRRLARGSGAGAAGRPPTGSPRSSTAVSGSPSTMRRCRAATRRWPGTAAPWTSDAQQERDAPQHGQPAVGAHQPRVLAPGPLRLGVGLPRAGSSPAVQDGARAAAIPPRMPGSGWADIAPRWLGARNSAITPTSGRRSGIDPSSTTRDRGVADDAEREEVARLPGVGGDGHRDADGEQSADRPAARSPGGRAGARRRAARPPTAAQMPVRSPSTRVGHDEGQGRQRGVHHAPPAAELVEHQVPVEREGRSAPTRPRLLRRRRPSCSPAPPRCVVAGALGAARSRSAAISRRPARTRGCR